MLTYLVRIEAKPGPIVEFDSPEPIEGYIQLLGVTARDRAELVRVVREYIHKNLQSSLVHKNLQSSLVNVIDMSVPDFENQDADIKEICGDMTKVGVWYYSGRFWFSKDDDDEDGEEEE
jgi:hypothetical protein